MPILSSGALAVDIADPGRRRSSDSVAMASYRPMLRPGASVLRRDARHLQIGTSPGAVIADHPGLHRLLLALDGVHEPDRLAEQVPEISDIQAVLSLLMASGVVLDAAGCDSRRPEEGRHLALIGRDPRAVSTRQRLRVSLHADPGTATLLRAVGTIIGEAGVDHTQGDDADLLVIASTGEAARQPFAEAVRHRIPHLTVRVDEGVVRIGPFVVPGVSACLDCEDLHRIDWDPTWAVLLPQFGRRSAGHNPPATGAVLRWAAAAEIAATIVDLADGCLPRRTGSVLTVGPAPGDRQVQSARFHQRCPCALLPPG